MNLYHLRYFSTLAHIEHYTKAADILAITQPSLSYAISTLEEELGVKLFEKNGRNVTLTKYGKVFLNDVEEVLNRLDSSVTVSYTHLDVYKRQAASAVTPRIRP